MNEHDNTRRRLARLAWLLDNSIALPGTRFRIGLDAILGLIPGLGDLIGVLASSYIVREAARLGAPPSVLMRMALNVAVEGIVGTIPFFGDVFDAVWKANQRNYVLLEQHINEPRRAAKSSRVVVGFVIAAMVALIIVTSVVTVLIIRAIWNALAT